MDALILCLSFVALSIGAYVVWPSRWNVPAHMNVGVCVMAYLIPVFITSVLRQFQPALVHFLALLLFAGASAYVAGLLLGVRGRPLARLPLRLLFHRMSAPSFQAHTLRWTRILALVSLTGMAASFVGMGFIPAFARDRLAAKYFRGAYAVPYQRVEWLLRGSLTVLMAVVPLVLIAWVITKRPSWLLLVGASLLTFALLLNRSAIGGGVLLILGLLAARRRSWTVVFVLFVAVAYPLGAMANRLVGLVQGVHIDIWQAIANGTPDVSDCLNFMFHFLGHPAFTHGRTFVGGLAPNRYEWNPSVYSLMVTNQGGNINRMVSGGLRLPAPVWGYTAFGWWGAVLVPFLSGVIQARFILFVRREGENKPLAQAVVVYLVYLAIGIGIAQFYLLSIYLIPPLAIYFCYLYLPSGGLARNRRPAGWDVFPRSRRVSESDGRFSTRNGRGWL